MITSFAGSRSPFLAMIFTVLIIAVAFSAGAVVASWRSASVSDWLSFAGALLGAGLTVAGGVALFEWQRGRELRERVTLLLEALGETIELTHGYHYADEHALHRATGRTVHDHTVQLRRSIDRLQSIRAWMTPANVRMLRAFDDIASLSVSYSDLEKGLNWKHVDGADLGGLNTIGSTIETLTASAIAHLKGKSGQATRMKRRTAWVVSGTKSPARVA